MKVELSRKDALLILRKLEDQLEREGDYLAAVSVELGRASIKRVPALTEIRYVNPSGNYVDVRILPENNDPKVPSSEKE